MLSENIKDRLKQPSALALYYASTSHIGYIFQIRTWRLWRVENHQKVARCVVANTRIGVLVLVNFQNDYFSVDYWIIY